MENGSGLSPLAELHLTTPSAASDLTLTLPARKLTWSEESRLSTPSRESFGRTTSSLSMRMKLSGRGSLFRRMNSAPSPTSLILPDTSGKENSFLSTRHSLTPTADLTEKENSLLIQRSTSQIRAPLEEHDTNSQDSGCSEDASTDVRFAIPSGCAPRKGVDPSPGKSWLGDDAVSPARLRQSLSMSSPGSFRAKSMRSLSFCSTDSFDDGFSEIPELEKLDNAPICLGSLLTGPLIRAGDDSNEPPASVLRLPLRRAFSMVENTNEPTNECRSVKRPLELKSDGGLLKRRKENATDSARHKIQRSVSENCADLSSTLSSLYGRPELIGDFSRPYALPVVAGKHSDLTSITADTLAGVVNGEFTSTVCSYTIIDCRYPYEFEGGRIRGATNLYTCEQIETALLNGSTLKPTHDSGHSTGRNILIFHCEFSVLRGPSLYRWLRRLDRNSSCYPSLQYPEVYLLHGGYENFHSKYPSLCDPSGYTPMKDPNHEADLRKFRSKSNSWTANRASFKRLYLC